MTKQEKELVLDKIEDEGFDYCFIHYSDWEEIKDKKFHALREAYIKAATELEAYCEK